MKGSGVQRELRRWRSEAVERGRGGGVKKWKGEGWRGGAVEGGGVDE